MVATRSSPRGERIIAIVTGANSGFGLGICHELLSNLSLPAGTPIPASTPQRSAIAPSLQHLLDDHVIPTDVKPVSTVLAPHPSLTLVLACRSASNAEEARAKILQRHERELAQRRKRGVPVPEGWEESLSVEYELVDFDAMGGDRGVLAFCQRVHKRYPYVTSLFLNAGYAAFTKIRIPNFIMQILKEGFVHSLHHPHYQLEAVGAMSADGERGRVWGINVLAPYILAKELVPLLRASPQSLPFAPRIVYTSSIEAEFQSLSPRPLEDYQLLSYEYSYRASKYMGDLIFTQLDRELGDVKGNGERAVRCIVAEPGCVTTNIATSGLGAWAWLVKIKWVCYWLAFYVAHLVGSKHHPVWATSGALPMLYAALVADKYLLPASKLPAPKLHVVSRRWRQVTVAYGEVDCWETNVDLGRTLAERCEQIRLDWHRREGLD